MFVILVKNEYIFVKKPIALYEWIYKNYATSDAKILDTYLGSGSSAIAAHNMDLSFVGVEINEKYFNDTIERFKKQTCQTKLF